MLMYLLEQESKDRALDYGLEFVIENAVGYDSPRDEETSTLVGVDVELPGDIESGISFNDFVADYCGQVLDCTIDDIVWTGVVKHEHSGVSYSTEQPSGEWSSHYEGFIYLRNETIKDEYSVKTIDQELKNKVLERFSDEMKEFTAWCVNDAYDLEIMSVDKKHKDSAYCVFNVNNAVDRVFNEMIDRLLCCIKEDGRNIDIKVGFKPGSIPSYMSAVHFFNSNINNVFKTVLTLSDFTIDKEAGVFEAKVNISSLDSFLNLAARISDSFYMNLFEMVGLAVAKIVSNEKLKPVDEAQVIKVLTANTPYDEWSLLMLKALMTVIVDQLPFFEMISTSEEGSVV